MNTTFSLSILSSPILALGLLHLGCSSTDDPFTPPPANSGGAVWNTGGSGTGASSPTGGSGGFNPGAGGAGTGASTGAGGVGANSGAGGGANPGAGGANPGAGGAGPGAGGNEGTGGTGEPAPPEPSLVTSGPDSAWWIESEVTIGGSSANVTVNVDNVIGDWHGFGGTFNEAGWDALKVLTEEERLHAIDLLFHASKGAGLTYGRIPIGSSDYGLSRYSLNETANDYEMNSFSIDRDKMDLIPYIKAALAVKPDIRFWASPWSPPTWMKSPAGFDGGSMKNDAQTLGAHALYLAKFVEEYEKVGIFVEAIHPQNEPGFTQGYPSCSWSGSQMADYIQNHLGPLFASRLPDREIWLGTMSNTTSTSIVSAVMGGGAAQYVKGIGLQWGMVASARSYQNNYNVPIMQTEHQCGNNPWEGNDQSRAPNDLAYGVESWGRIKEWLNAGVNSYLAWNMVLDTNGVNLDTSRRWAQNALLAVDRNAKKLNITPYYYVFRHLAQFVEPGSQRVSTQGGDALAWKNTDGSVVVVMYNSGGSPAQTTVDIGGTLLQLEIPSRGWATVNWAG